MRRLRKIISITLVVVIIFSFMPVITPSVYGASNDDYNVFDALGIDDSVAPAGFDSSNDDNPYGSSTVNIMPVSELFTADSNGKNIFGHNKTFLGDSDEYYVGEAVDSTDLTDTPGTGFIPGIMMSHFNSVSGDFTGNGLKNEIVVLGAGFEDTYDEQEPANLIDRKMETIQLFFDGGDNDNPTNTLEFKTNPWAYVSDDFKSDKNLIYNYLKLAAGDFTGDGIDEIAFFVPEYGSSRIMIYQLQIPSGHTPESSWNNAANWGLLYNHTIKSNGEVPNKVTLLASDLTGDGIDDLGIAYGKVDNNHQITSKVQVLNGSKNNNDRFNVIAVPLDEIYKASIATGDIDGDRKNEFVVAGYPALNRNDYIYLAYYEYNDDLKQFILRKKNTIEAFNGDSGAGIFNTQLTTISKEGLGKKAHIYVDGGTFELIDGSFQYQFGSKITTDYKVDAVDLTGNGKEELLINRLDGDNNNICIYKVSGVYHQYKVFNNQKYATTCNTDEDTVQMKFLGKRVVYSDPKILAVLASPPYFKDLEHLDGGDSYVGNSATSYGTSEGSSESETHASTISAGTYVSFEQEFSFFGFKAASVEAEAEFSASWTNETEETSSRTQTIEYSTAGGQDTVVLYSIPLVIYEYEAKLPVVNGNTIEWQIQKSTITEPREATVRTYTLEAYDEIAKYYDILPIIGGNILKHELGNPATYPTSTAGYRDVNQPDGPSIGVGYGSGGSITQTLELTEETSVGTSFSASISTKVGGGAGGVTAGVTAGYEGGSGTVKTDLNGKFFSTTIVGMPEEANGYGYDYNVKMFQYNKNYSEQSIPIVNYVVSQLSMPPIIPADFGIDNEGTTSNQVKLTWTDMANGDKVIGYQLYKQYDFPDGVSDFPIKFIEANQKDSNGVFSFIDTNLTPNTNYKYKIQVLANQNPDRSVKSDVLIVKTRPGDGYPEISLAGLEDGTAKVYPDVEKSIKATVTNSETNVGTPVFQWQKLVNGQWKDLSGKISDTLTFSNSNLTINGKYRVRVNQFVNENAVSAYSGAFSVEFAKRDVEDQGISVVATGDDKVTLSITLCNSSSSTKPTGNVVFQITGDGYSKTIAQALDNNQTATIEDLVLPNEGLYNINAYYSGNKVFNALSLTKKYLKGDETSYWLEISDVPYGESVSPVITEYKSIEGVQTSKEIQNDSNYTIDYNYTNKADNSIVEAKNVGNYNVEVVIKKDENTLATLNKDFSITQKQVTIIAPTLEKTQSQAITPELSTITVDPGLTNGDIIEDVGLTIVALDNSGRIIPEFSPESGSDPFPGRYTSRVISKDNDNITETEKIKQLNYEITFVDGLYTVIGATHQVTMLADKLLGKSVGTIELISPEEAGSLEFQQNTTLAFKAISDVGYEVDKWFVKAASSENYEEVNLTAENKNIFKQNMPGEAIDVKVLFKVKETRLKFSVANGTITCVNIPNLKTGNTVTKNGTFTFSAVALEGYHFAGWEKIENNSTSYPLGTIDDNGNPQISVTIGDYDVTLVAVFERDSYQLSLSDNLRAYYMSNGNKVYITNNTAVGDTEITVEPDIGFEVSQDENGVYQWNSSVLGSVSQDGQTYTFTITENTIIESMLETTSLTGNIMIAEGSFGDNEVVLKIEGVETPYTLGQDFNFNSGDTIILEPKLDYGAKVKEYNYNGNISTNEKLTIPDVTEDLEIVASFEEMDKYEIDFSEVDNRLHGSLIVEVVGQEVEFNENKLPVYIGDTVTITAQPDSGYMVGYWTIDDVRTSTNQKIRILENITDNHKITCEFNPLVYYTLNFSAGENGTVLSVKDDIISINTGSTIGGGSKLVFTASPDSEYMVEKWVVNGETVVNEFGEEYVGKMYTIDGLSEGTNVTVSFVSEVKHTISVNASEGFTISEEILPDEYPGTNTIREGAAYVFTIAPDVDYRIESVSAKGAADNEITIDKIIKNDDGSWICTINSIKENTTVNVSAVKLYDVIMGTFDVREGTVTITPSAAAAGDTVIITARTSYNYKFNKWEVLGEVFVGQDIQMVSITPVDELNESTTFVMPDGNVTVTPSFTYRKIDSGGGGGNITMPPVQKNIVNIAIEEGKKNDDNKILATIQLKDSNANGSYEQAIPNDFFGKGDKVLQIDTPIGQVTLPDDIFDELADEDVHFNIKQVSINDLKLSEDKKEQIGNKPIIDINILIGKEKTKWQSKNKVITLSIPLTLTAEEQTDPHKVIAVYIDDDGNIIPLKSSAYDPEKGAIVFKTNHTSYYSVQYVNKKFEDIGTYTWAEESIDALRARGIISGISEKKFAPQNNITRADFVLLLAKFLELKNSGNKNFIDLEEGIYYYDAVASAKELGIIFGTGDNMFKPLDFITRQDMFVIIERALKITNVTNKLIEDSGKSLKDFPDSVDVSDYATNSVDYLINKGIVLGDGININPKSNIKRAEVAVILYRLLGQLNK